MKQDVKGVAPWYEFFIKPHMDLDYAPIRRMIVARMYEHYKNIPSLWRNLLETSYFWLKFYIKVPLVRYIGNYNSLLILVSL